MKIKSKNIFYIIKTRDKAFPAIPDNEKKLTLLKKCLVSPPVPFIKIGTQGIDRQKGIKDAIVLMACDVQTNIMMVVCMLSHETQTFHVKLKQKVEYKNHYQYETIRTKVVHEYLEHRFSR